MVRIAEIQEKMLHLIGWRQSYDTNDVVVSEMLTESESGMYYQDTHPLLTLQNLSSIAPDFKNISYPVHSIEEAYKKGVVVTLEEKYYRALQDVPADVVEITNEEYWAETNPFSEWLETKTKASIVKAINRFVNEKVVKGTYKTLCEKKTLFDGTGRIYDTIKNKKNLVGLEIVPIRSKGVTTKINRIGLQFTEPGEYTILIMHSSCQEPYYSETFTKIKNNAMEWFTPKKILYLPYEDEKIDNGGSWYICYFQSQLPEGSQAIRKNRDWSQGPCNQCSRYEYEAWKLWSKYIEVHPFFVNEEFVPYNEDTEEYALWDIESNQYIYDTNFGLNLDITISCDITDFIIDQRNMFQSYISLQVASDFLREFAYNANIRTNRHSVNASRVDILYELDGDSTSRKRSGVNYQLELALNALNISTEGIDRVCMPCINHGIKYRTV